MTRRLHDFQSYDYAKIKDVLGIGDAWATILTLTTPARDADVYEVGMSMTRTFDIGTESASVRFRLNGSAWTTFISQPSDKSDEVPSVYIYPHDHTGGIMTIEFQATKETGSVGTFNIQFLDLWFKRLGSST